ncbi:CD209 antigen-like protein E isoform X2 [Lampris incognitus]|uniref:CD209 antigen-like protein E isoform X2 n=1 Tax=Lampris incognitus TaxID=2546036 RepID=UPI0024B5D519|nr:CD209 antigen-like protein E isoform X2 [Lampris incognitus]
MKTLLLLMVLLCAALPVRAAAEAVPEDLNQDSVQLEGENKVEMAPSPVEAENKVEMASSPVEAENKVEIAPSPVEAENKVEMAPSPDDMTVDGGEMAAQLEGRSFLCPYGWVGFRNVCYQYVTSGRSWTSAEAYCSRLGASLLSVHNVWDYSYFQELTRRSGHTAVWTGGYYFQGWRWLDQSQFDYNNWSTVNAVSQYQCIKLNSRVAWSNINCASVLPFICVRRSDTC